VPFLAAAACPWFEKNSSERFNKATMKSVSRGNTWRWHGPFGDDDIAQLLRLKRYEQPPASYYENFLSKFRRRQRDELLGQPLWRICFERAHEQRFPSASCFQGGVRKKRPIDW